MDDSCLTVWALTVSASVGTTPSIRKSLLLMISPSFGGFCAQAMAKSNWRMPLTGEF
jgi:hypothetical protein